MRVWFQRSGESLHCHYSQVHSDESKLLILDKNAWNHIIVCTLLVGGLIWFNGILAIVGYLMSNPFYIYIYIYIYIYQIYDSLTHFVDKSIICLHTVKFSNNSV